MREPRPDDLIAVVDLSIDTLRPLVDRDWSAKAGPLDWTCRETIEHVCSLAYGPVLATRATEFRPLALNVAAGAPVDELLWTMKAMAHMLAEVARAAPPTARAFHPAGMADPSGFVAMGMDEILLHTGDIASGLGADFEADESLATIVLDRLFPWWPREVGPGPALLWANGRRALPDHGQLGAEWLWHCAPIDIWDGTIPRWDPVSNRPVKPA